MDFAVGMVVGAVILSLGAFLTTIAFKWVLEKSNNKLMTEIREHTSCFYHESLTLKEELKNHAQLLVKHEEPRPIKSQWD